MNIKQSVGQHVVDSSQRDFFVGLFSYVDGYEERVGAAFDAVSDVISNWDRYEIAEFMKKLNKALGGHIYED